MNVAASAPTGTNALTNTASDPTTITGPPALTLIKTVTDVNGGTPEPGDTLEYTIAVSSTGPDGATSVVLSDSLPANTVYVPGSLILDAAPQTAAASDDTAAFDAANNHVVFRVGTGAGANAGGTLAPSATATVIFRVTLAPNTPPGTQVNNQATATFSAQSSGATGYTTASTVAGVRLPGGTPTLLLVKRITRINGVDVPGFVNDASDPANDYANWPRPLSTYLRGAINAGAVRPGDSVEYTIYFLSSGDAIVTNVLLCDVLKDSTAFVPGAFSGQTPRDAGALPGVDLGIGLALSGSALPTAPTVFLTNVADDDRGRFYAPGTQAPAAANRTANIAAPLPMSEKVAGVVAVFVVRASDAGSPSLPPATSLGIPANSYGFIRFRVMVK